MSQDVLSPFLYACSICCFIIDIVHIAASCTDPGYLAFSAKMFKSASHIYKKLYKYIDIISKLFKTKIITI